VWCWIFCGWKPEITFILICGHSSVLFVILSFLKQEPETSCTFILGRNHSSVLFVMLSFLKHSAWTLVVVCWGHHQKSGNFIRNLPIDCWVTAGTHRNKAPADKEHAFGNPYNRHHAEADVPPPPELQHQVQQEENCQDSRWQIGIPLHKEIGYNPKMWRLQNKTPWYQAQPTHAENPHVKAYKDRIGGSRCHKCVRDRIIRAFLIEEQKIVVKVLKAQAQAGKAK